MDIENPKKAEWSKKINKQYFVETNDSIFPLALFDGNKTDFDFHFYPKKHIFKCDSMEFFNHIGKCNNNFYIQNYVGNHKYMTLLIQHAYKELSKFGVPKFPRIDHTDQYIKEASEYKPEVYGFEYWVNFSVYWEIKYKNVNYFIVLDSHNVHEGCLVRIRHSKSR